MEERVCLICNSPITSTHFGLDACRACCLFFKRTKLAGRVFECNGSDRCVIKKDDNKTCRKCRFDRCVEVGMEYEGPKRKSRKKKETKENLRKIVNGIIQSPCTSSSSVGESILERIEKEYSECCKIRLAQEKILHIIFTLQRIPHPSLEIFLSNLSFSKKCLQITIFESVNFARRTFPAIEELQIEEQRLIFKGFITKFCVIEGHYRTVKLWPNERYYMSSLTTCFDMENNESWLPNTEKHAERTNLLGTMLNYATDQFSIVFPMLRKAEITEVEFHALLAFALCDWADAESEIPDGISRIFDAIKTETVADLQRYYTRDMGLTNYSNRIGNLITLNQLARESSRLMQEEFRMYSAVFDMYSNDEILRELFI
ncbi:hypothetical protein PFISCL1PPCAC_14737 [Pristionchus fissidentatus]|uniref:Nuclear receptor n=1 Tax=Pristionchus fissidentatus TaxID=1538716 RepID=A0AAV5VY77_9BILA|nr:hypothetical protein PFISCL1PPCAC_14737 [Pristionchus fissidentatus]